MVKCSEVLQCKDGTSNKVSNIIIRLTDNRKLYRTIGNVNGLSQMGG